MKKSLYIFIAAALSAVISLGGCSKEESVPHVTGIELSENSIVLPIGGTVQLEATVLPENAAIDSLVWSSSDENVAEVDRRGLVTALTPGKTVIRVSCNGISSVCDVIVEGIDMESIAILTSETEVQIGETFQLELETVPADAWYDEVKWMSFDESVASVDENGLVTGTGLGETVITAVAGGMSANCNVTVVPVKLDVKVGDFFYSDGTVSSTLEPEKTVVGVVFWTGDPTEDDAVLKREHPHCVNGLAVSMGGDGSVNWQTGYKEYGKTLNEWVLANLDGFAPVLAEYNAGSEPDYMNMILGYNNTRAMEEFNAAPENSSWPCEAVRFIKDYAETVPLPEWCSGWYLPSIKELSLLCSGDYAGDIREISYNNMQTANRDFINERLLMVEGANHICTTCLFWSSTECSQPLSYCNHFEAGLVFRNNKASLAGGAVCRAIFAF